MQHFTTFRKKTSHHGWSKYAIDKSNVADVRHLVKPTILNISAMRWAGFDIWTKFGSVMQLGSLERIVCHILNFRTFNMAAAAVLNFEIVQVENVLNCDITPTVWRISNKFSRSIKRRAKC